MIENTKKAEITEEAISLLNSGKLKEFILLYIGNNGVLDNKKKSAKEVAVLSCSTRGGASALLTHIIKDVGEMYGSINIVAVIASYFLTQSSDVWGMLINTYIELRDSLQFNPSKKIKSKESEE